MERFQKILAAVDFTGVSDGAAAKAADLARRLGAQLTFCHVLDARYMGMAPATLVEPPALQEERLRNTARKRMDDLMRGLDLEGVETRPVIRCGIPADEILDEIEESGADLVVLGTHGRRGLSRALMGSQAEAVLRRCPVPALVVRPSDPDSASSAA